MRGTVTKKGNRWYICYYTGKDCNGKWKLKWESGFNSKRDAERVLRERISDIENSFNRKVDNSTLDVFLHYWLDTYCKERLAPNTIRGYKTNIENHIIPHLGNIRLSALSPHDIQRLYTKLLEKGLSGTSVRYVHNNLHRALSFAVKQELIPRNPADLVEPPAINHYEATTLNEVQVRQLLSSCFGTDIYLPILLAVSLGLRRGEVLALQWSDIDWQYKTVTIRHSASYTRDGMYLGSPKSRSSRRTLILPDIVIDALHDEYCKQNEMSSLFGDSFNPMHFICCNSNGSMLSSNALQHKFVNALETCNLPRIRFHDLRHTNATLMLRNSVPSKIVSSMLGHSSIGITLDTYSHVITEMQQSAVNVMNDIISFNSSDD